MKKKIVTLSLVVALAATALIGGTLAYFTDDDSARNVMNLGNVQIIQNEKEADGTTDFEQNKIMLPAVLPSDISPDNIIAEDGNFRDDITNVVDKFVTVTNDGNIPAYVRTLIAFEGTYAEHDRLVYVNGDYDYVKDSTGKVVEFTYNDQTFCVAVKVYEQPVAADATTETSLRQLFFAPHTVNTDMAQFGSTYDVLVLSQAVQADGFTEGAEKALDTAFGDVATNAATWFQGIVGTK